MINISPAFLFATLTTVIVLGFPSQSNAQLQEAVWEKSYCVDEWGTVIRFDQTPGVMPPYGTAEGIVGDTEALDSLTPRTAQFLFTRACLEAVTISSKTQSKMRLECQTAKFLARRFYMRPRETFQIIEELSFDDSTQHIARNLSLCL